jgi:hypothetical protein
MNCGYNVISSGAARRAITAQAHSYQAGCAS